jgi:hypothetical protein
VGEEGGEDDCWLFCLLASRNDGNPCRAEPLRPSPNDNPVGFETPSLPRIRCWIISRLGRPFADSAHSSADFRGEEGKG